MSWYSDLFSKTPADNKEKKPVSHSAAHSVPRTINRDKQPVSVLKQFIPIRNLDDALIETLPQATLTYDKDSLIFQQGEKSDGVFYLLRGRIKLQPQSKNTYVVDPDDARAHLPLNSGSVFGATATALTEVSLLAVSVELNKLWKDQSSEDISCSELVDIELPEQLNNNRFFTSFAQAYRENKLQLPTLPNVALKLREAMQHDISVREAVDIIHIDPTIVTKLIQLANSALYAPTTPVTNCHNAVVRLGLEATRTLVMSIGLKQLFNCKEPRLMKAMQSLWQSSLQISCLCYVLAQETDTVNPEDALLAGLICDIGVIPLLHYASQHPDQYPEQTDLNNAIPYLCAPVGALVLHTLGFSDELSNIPHQAENWFYDSGEEITLTDIVILAKLHNYFGKPKAKELPHINTILAYAKLKNGQLTPDFSLTILHKAQQRFHAALSILA